MMFNVPSATYVEVHLRSGAQLLELLYAIDQRQRDGMRLYRGHADTEWPLTPGLFREADATTQLEVLKGFERRLLSNLRTALSHGTTTPERLLGNQDYLLGLAQHYGALTRCLDWTTSPLQAAYFAAAGAVTRPCKRDMCVFTTSAFRYIFSSEDSDSRLLHCPAADNHHIRAQNGQLVLHGWSDRKHWPNDHVEAKPDDLESIIRARVSKINVPWAASAWILDQLRRRGIDGSQAYAGTKGHVQYAGEQAMMFVHPNVTWKQYGDVDDDEYDDYDDVRDAELE